MFAYINIDCLFERTSCKPHKAFLQTAASNVLALFAHWLTPPRHRQRCWLANMDVDASRSAYCAGMKGYTHEAWRTHTLRLSPQFACLVSGDLQSDVDSMEPAQTGTFSVPASVRVLHLLSPGAGFKTKYQPTLMGPSLQELHVDIDAWDAKAVRRVC